MKIFHQKRRNEKCKFNLLQYFNFFFPDINSDSEVIYYSISVKEQKNSWRRFQAT